MTLPGDDCQEIAKEMPRLLFQPLADAIRNIETSTPLPRVRLVGCHSER